MSDEPDDAAAEDSPPLRWIELTEPFDGRRSGRSWYVRPAEIAAVTSEMNGTEVRVYLRGRETPVPVVADHDDEPARPRRGSDGS
jgi:hypothetical protein